MANIMITDLCNLACPYCFADAFVNKKIQEITVENFRKALEFIIHSKAFYGKLGIIGGEPTLHHDFSHILSIANQVDQVKEIVIFTNGIKLHETMDLISEPKFSFLINLNAPEVIGERIYARILKNIDDLVVQYKKKNSITLGLNLYKLDMDYSFFINLLQKYRFRNARLSITVPNLSAGNENFNKFALFKNQVYQLYIDLRYRGINAIFDCNRLPACLWTEDEVMKISLIQASDDNSRIGFNFLSNKCNPVVDILPDLSAVRCFGLSQSSRVKIDDFPSLDDLIHYYEENFDKKYVQVPSISECQDCEMFQESSCYGGCLANKMTLAN